MTNKHDGDAELIARLRTAAEPKLAEVEREREAVQRLLQKWFPLHPNSSASDLAELAANTLFDLEHRAAEAELERDRAWLLMKESLEAAEARLAEVERDMRIAQGNTDAAIADYNDALARIATLTGLLLRIKEVDPEWRHRIDAALHPEKGTK